MCGIVGYVGAQQAAPILIDGLRRLEYRGYDSAGIAVLGRDKVEVRKRAGKLANLVGVVEDDGPVGSVGIGHTRWATHGRPNDDNAHPHTDCQGEISVVHNGIIENYAELRDELRSAGHTFLSETDTEVLAHLIEFHYRETQGDLFKAVRLALGRVTGTYSIAVVSQRHPDLLIGARYAGPLIVGLGEHEQFLASDIPALLKHTRQVIILEEGELVALRPEGVELCDLAGNRIEREPLAIEWDVEAAEKGGYDHFMLKEIHEQPEAIRRALLGRLVETPSGLDLRLPELAALEAQGAFSGIERVVVVACGTSLYAGLIAKYMLEQWARVPVEVVSASEFRYSDPVVGPEVLCLPITQSGETADTLAGVRQAREGGAPVISLTNSVGSAITRLSDAVLYLQAGPEICVVGTKTFVTSVTVLSLLSLHLGRLRGTLSADELTRALGGLQAIPGQVQRILDRADGADDHLKAVARELSTCSSFMFIGRGVGYPIALEGALKLKEVSYIHAEGYPAGELKHGPIALLDPDTPLLAIATSSKTYDKVISNIQEVRARDARVVAVATEGDSAITQHAHDVFFVPYAHELLAPLLQVIPLQLFAYHAAVARGCSIDQPRNLAKSVTVE
ncbi:MAG TPA: glutamine--fructose-6-phosphate transaminase (isomerizing) [Ktedonobacterales bacterium]|nr:glutamine--fructose-6-phosphate transaminase (isomerizing) [Ktedonobacterales bacterium]